VETIGSKWSYALTWCMPNNDDDDDTGCHKILPGNLNSKVNHCFNYKTLSSETVVSFRLDCAYCLQNDLYCVRWGVKLYSI